MKDNLRIRPLMPALVLVLFEFLIFWQALEELNSGSYGVSLAFATFAGKQTLLLFSLLVAWVFGSVFLLMRIALPRSTFCFEKSLASFRNRTGWLSWIIAMSAIILPGWLIQFTVWGDINTDFWLRMYLSFGMALIAAIGFSRNGERLLTVSSFSVGLLMTTGSLILMNMLARITEYPFSLSWSEGNRIWDFSVLFGRRLYDFPADKKIFAYIDLGRQSIWGLPFLFFTPNIIQMRLWIELVLIIPLFIFGLIVFKRQNTSLVLWLLTALWVLIFLSQGPIYTPLVICAILVAVAWRRSIWISLLLILGAGYLAQASRFTWMFAPALWAVMLYFSDSGFLPSRKQRWIYAALGGIAGLFGGFLLPKLINIISSPETSLKPSVTDQPDLISLEGIGALINRQPLLWDRLLPNPTFSPGILLALTLVCLPLIILLVYMVVNKYWSINGLQRAAVIAVLSLFLIVGLVISVKIGGGSNLHNLDMFLIGLVFAAALAWVAGSHQFLLSLDEQPGWIQVLLILMISIYAFQPLLVMSRLQLPPTIKIKNSLSAIQREVQNAKQEGEILFLDQRQLLTFGYVKNVPLVPDYEKKYLMDQAMTGDQVYFDEFYKDLSEARFSLIISEPLKSGLQQTGRGEDFVEENNAWVKWVSMPILCYYKPLATYKDVHVQLLVPKDPMPETCP